MWMTADWAQAQALQRPLANDALTVLPPEALTSRGGGFSNGEGRGVKSPPTTSTDGSIVHPVHIELFLLLRKVKVEPFSHINLAYRLIAVEQVSVDVRT